MIGARAWEIVNLARACDYYPFPSRWECPRAAREREIAVSKPVSKANRATPSRGKQGDLPDWVWGRLR